MDKRELVLHAVSKLTGLTKECNLELSQRLGMAELQLNQLHYLQIINRTVGLTFSQFAEILKVSKPSVTEIVNKLIKVDCVRKVRCQKDGRMYYIELTEKGKNISQVQNLAEQKLVDIILRNLDDGEIETFVLLVRKL
ncbi:MAG: MarR family transcriptional regulator [Proteobacteria bacterium]|nr:MarR family transcriptional regulator [Pseudomonadota bacterium]